VYHSLKEEIADLGVIFDDLSNALKNPKYEALIKKHFAKSIPLTDHKFASLHYAVWS
jgi:Fe-S cluster assembly protein SufB